jgi:hypothetical protein
MIVICVPALLLWTRFDRTQRDCGNAFDGLLRGQLPVEMAEPLLYSLLGGGHEQETKDLGIGNFSRHTSQRNFATGVGAPGSRQTDY